MARPAQDETKITQFVGPKRMKSGGTVGIIGLDKLEVAKLNAEIVRQANLVGLDIDQDIPNIIALGFPGTDDYKQFKTYAETCYDFGCDLIAIADGTPDIATRLSEDLSKNSDYTPHKKFPVFSPPPAVSQESKEKWRERYAATILSEARITGATRRPNLVCEKEYSEENYANILRNIEEDNIRRRERLQRREQVLLEEADDPEIGEKKLTCILGGSGPAASADFALKLAEKGSYYIHVSENCTPLRHNYEMFALNQGPPAHSYTEHYRNIVSFFEIFSATINPGLKLHARHLVVPCNTSHRSLPKFCGSELEVLDLRQAATSKYLNRKPVILLGTNTSTGVGIGGATGTYELYRLEHNASHPDIQIPPFKVCEEDEQQKILQAIFDIKAGKMDQAKQAIIEVIGDLRSRHGADTPVIMGCTELALPFTPYELMALRFIIDPMERCAKIISSGGKETRSLSSTASVASSVPPSTARPRGKSQLGSISETFYEGRTP